MLKFAAAALAVVIVSVTAFAQAPTLRITQPDGPNLPSELWYGNVKVKPLRFRPGTNTPITIDDSDFFVSQIQAGSIFGPISKSIIRAARIKHASTTGASPLVQPFLFHRNFSRRVITSTVFMPARWDANRRTRNLLLTVCR